MVCCINVISMVHKVSLLYAIREYERRKEMFYLTSHSTQFIYSYMASDIW